MSNKLKFMDKLPSYKAVSVTASVLTPFVNENFLGNPHMLTFVVTRRCNSRCEMCNIWKQTDLPQLSLEQIETIFERHDFSFLRYLTLTGGEPTMRADLVDIFKVVLAATPQLEHVTLATSALNRRKTRTHVHNMLKHLAEAPNKVKTLQVQISVDGIDEMHDAVRGIKGFFEILKNTLSDLFELQKEYPVLRMRLSTVVMPRNLSHIPKIQAFADEIGLRYHFSPVVMSGNYYANTHAGEMSELTFLTGQADDAIVEFDRLSHEEPSALRYYYQDMTDMLKGEPRQRKCMMGFYNFVLEFNGNIYACVNCEQFPFGNLLTQTWDEAWFGARATKARQNLREHCCPTCVSMCYPEPVNAGEVLGQVWRSKVKPLWSRSN